MFEVVCSDPDRLRGFLTAMTGVSRGANLAIAGNFPWAGYKSCARRGHGDEGDLVAQIALAHPHLTGIGYDSRW